MIQVTRQQLWFFLSTFYEGDDQYPSSDYEQYKAECEDAAWRSPNHEPFDEERWNALCEAKKNGKLVTVVADSEMSEHNLGGDDLITLSSQVAEAVAADLVIATWYGPNLECLIAAYDHTVIEVIDPPN